MTVLSEGRAVIPPDRIVGKKINCLRVSAYIRG